MHTSPVCSLHRTRRVALVALLCTACSAGLTEPGRPAPALALTPVRSPGPPPSPAVMVTEKTVTVSGVLTTPTPCYDVGATDAIAGDTLVVHLVARNTVPSGGACVQVLADIQFTVTSFDVPTTVTQLRLDVVTRAGQTPSVIVNQAIRIR